MSGESNGESFPSIIELNVGGVFYTTSLTTLTKDDKSVLTAMFTGKTKEKPVRDSKGKFFIDRDGVLFRYILDYLRNQRIVLPESFHEKERLKQEAEHFGMVGMAKQLSATIVKHLPPISPNTGTINNTNAESLVTTPVIGGPGYIIISYRGTFAFGRDGLADVKFRKLSRILVCGRVQLCREVFGETLNESRDPDRGTSDRYTSRFFLKHSFLEQCFDMLQEANFRLVGTCASGTNSAGEVKPGMDNEENKWNHYNEFVFVRDPPE